MNKLPKKIFLAVVRNTPLISVDLLVHDPAGRVLLGQRVNKPAQHTWFVPGGKILKDELLGQAFQRIARDEVGLDGAFIILPGGEVQFDQPQPLIRSIRFKGVYEHFYPDNFANAKGISTHYVVLAYELQLLAPLGKLPADQHSDYRWWQVDELLASDEVHPNTKAYFRP